MAEVESVIVRVPVSAFGEAHSIAAKLYRRKNCDPGRAVFCFPGGTYNKSYFDIANAGENYSLANALAQDGSIVICLDHLGIGDSTRPVDGDAVTRDVLADTGAAAVDHVVQGLKAGTLVPTWPAIAEIPLVGVGHSLGGLILLRVQARHHSFDAIAVLGWTNQPTAVAHDFAPSEPYVHVDRTALRRFFHMDDVPDAIIVADDLNAEPVPAGILVEGQQDRISQADAQSVAVPVFICFGERDCCPNPHLEPSTYPSSDDVTMFRLLHSAHNHNFASSRLQLFKRLSSWIANRHVR